MKAVVLFSGGMDSAVMLADALTKYDEIYALTVFYGQRHDKEVKAAYNQIKALKTTKLKQHATLDLSSYGGLIAQGTALLGASEKEVPNMRDIIGHPQSVTYVPNRNMTFLSAAAGYAETVGAEKVCTAIVELDNLSGYYDCTQPFIDNMNAVLNLNRMHKIQIECPLVSLSKREIILRGVELGVDFSKTWTCYKGGEKSCGECPSCAGRIKGFIDAGFIDPLPYTKEINWDKYQCVELPVV
jgi:7-cyano-7-deazaguanine synthase